MLKEHLDKMRMVTISESGERTIATKGEAFLWFSKHVKTRMHADAVFAGIPTAMIDGSKVVFEEWCNECMSEKCQQL